MDENFGQSQSADSIMSHPIEFLIPPQRTNQRILIEEISDEQQNTKTDTPDVYVAPVKENRVCDGGSRVRHEVVNDGLEDIDSRVCDDKTRAPIDNTRVSSDDIRSSSDSGISIDVIQKLAEEVGSTVIEREPLNIEQKVREFKQKNVLDVDDIDD